MIVGQVMTSKLLTVAPETTIIAAARLMLEHHISGLPVIDDENHVVGMVTEGDLLRRAETGTARHRSAWMELLLGPGRLAHDYVDTHARKVGEVMTREVFSVSPHDPLSLVVELMEKRHIKRLPVVSKDRLVGIVSRADLVRALLNTLTGETETPTPVGDADIKAAVTAIIEREPWGPRFSVDVVVEDGVVDLHGTITDDRERAALTVAAENVPGVKAVHDHLVWVEPNSGIVIGAEEGR